MSLEISKALRLPPAPSVPRNEESVNVALLLLVLDQQPFYTPESMGVWWGLGWGLGWG